MVTSWVLPCETGMKQGGVAATVEQRLELDRGFATAEFRPREERQAEVDGGRIERGTGLVEHHAERFVRVKFAGLRDEDASEVGEDSPVVGAAGIGERAPRDATAEAGVIEFGSECAEAGFDVAETLAVGELGEG